jgi:hypothetical protein
MHGGRPPGRKFQQPIDMGERAWGAAKPTQTIDSDDSALGGRAGRQG